MIVNDDASSAIEIYNLFKTTSLFYFFKQFFFVVAQHVLKHKKYHVQKSEYRSLSLNEIVS